MPRALALIVGIALFTAGCGSSSNKTSTSTSAAASAATRAPAAGGTSLDGELVRLNEAVPWATASIPSRSAGLTVDRAYLTALFDDAQAVWRREFEASHVAFQRARLVLFSGKVQSACGHHEASGPFYCPGDSTVYLDLRFMSELLRQAGEHGAAQAYIVGHEYAHHVQALLGIGDRVAKANEADPSGSNARSVQVELQADCLSGVWGRSAFRRSALTIGDLYEALKAAKVIGDDYIMRAAGDVVDSKLWTHGSSQQRQQWAKTGYDTGRPSTCDTLTSG